MHLSQENFAFLKKESNPHVVANYFKKILQKLDPPLIPYQYYDELAELNTKPSEKMFIGLQKLVKDLKPLNRNTIKFVLEFLFDISTFENENLMTV